MGNTGPEKGKENPIPSRPRVLHSASVRQPKVAVTFINCGAKSWRPTEHQSQVALSHAARISHIRRRSQGLGQTISEAKAGTFLRTKFPSRWEQGSNSTTAHKRDNDPTLTDADKRGYDSGPTGADKRDNDPALTGADKRWKTSAPESLRRRLGRRTYDKMDQKSANLSEIGFVSARRFLDSSNPFDVSALPLSPRDSYLIKLAHSFGLFGSLFVGGSATSDKHIAREIAEGWVSDLRLSLSNKALLHALIALGASICASGRKERNEPYTAYAAKHKLVAISSLRGVSIDQLRTYHTLILIRLLIACEFYLEDIAAADVHQRALYHLFSDMTRASGHSHISTGTSDIWTAAILGQRTRSAEGDHDPGPWRQCFSTAALRLVNEYASVSAQNYSQTHLIDSSLRFNVKLFAILERFRDVAFIDGAAKKSAWTDENRDVEHEIKRWLHFYRVETSKLLNNVAVDHTEALSSQNLGSEFVGYHALSCAMALALRCQWLLISHITSVAQIQLGYWDLNANVSQRRLLNSIKILENSPITLGQENMWFYVLFIHTLFVQYRKHVGSLVVVKEEGGPRDSDNELTEAIERLRREKHRRGLHGVTETKGILLGFWPHNCYDHPCSEEIWQVLSDEMD